MIDSKNDKPITIFVASDIRHLVYFSSILTNQNTLIFCIGEDILNACYSMFSKKQVHSAEFLKSNLDSSRFNVSEIIIPLDQSDSISVVFTINSLSNFKVVGISASILDPECQVKIDLGGATAALKDIVNHFDLILTPDADPNLYLEGVEIQTTGVYLNAVPIKSKNKEGILIINDFSAKQADEKVRWLSDVNESLKKVGLDNKAVDLSPQNYSQLDFIKAFQQVLAEAELSKVVITSRSYVYYILRACGIPTILYDRGPFISTTYCRDFAKGAAYVRYKRDLARVVDTLSSTESHEFIIPLLTSGLNQELSYTYDKGEIDKSPEQHIVIWGRMPPYSYSGGRYHGWLLAEGLANLNYHVTVFTDNCPYFINDFAHLPHHKRIVVKTTENFKDTCSYPPFNASAVILIPGMDRLSELYQGAIDYAKICDAKLGLINFESPNWFNSLVYPPRDERLWKYWEITSRFASLILSTTQISTDYAKDYYINANKTAKFENLYAPINSSHSDELVEINNKEKRVVVFFPRHGYSAHKGWQQIVDCIGADFRDHTVVFLCGESDLPSEVLEQLNQISTQYKFNIEYKVKIDDREKFIELSRACLLIFPSQFEGYGYPPIEALSVGTPCVAFDLPVLRETCQEYLLFAPKGDFETFKYLCNKALKDQFRVPIEAVQRANQVAHFDSFCSKLTPIIEDLLTADTVWRNTDVDVEEEVIDDKIAKAFYQNEQVVSDIKSSLPKSIVAKAIIKEQRSIIEECNYSSPKICHGPRIMILMKNSSILKSTLGENQVSSYVQFAKHKGFLVDVLSEDFALESLADEFIFTGGKYISLGGVKDNEVRTDASLIILKLISQYSYKEIISVDGYLERELPVIINHPDCPKVSALARNVSPANLNTKNVDKVLCSAFVNNGNSRELINIPTYIYPNRDRKQWLVSGHSLKVATFIESDKGQLTNFIAGIDRIRQSLGQDKLNLNVVVISTKQLADLPYYIKCSRVKNNDQIYSLLKQSTVFIHHATDETELSRYVVEMAKLVGSCAINADPTWHSNTLALLSNRDDWLRRRRERFNEVLNLISSPQYLSGIYPEAFGEFFSLRELIQLDVEQQADNASADIKLLKKQLNKSLDEGYLETAGELANRLYIATDSISVQFLQFEIALINRNFEVCKQIYNYLRKEYPFEEHIMTLATRINRAMNNMSLACQSAYYGVMLGTTDIKQALNASISSLNGGRDIDSKIHKIMCRFFTENPIQPNEIKSFSKREQIMINAMIREHQNYELN